MNKMSAKAVSEAQMESCQERVNEGPPKKRGALTTQRDSGNAKGL